MDKEDNKLTMPENPSWSQMVSLVSELMAENTELKNSWRLEVVQQAKKSVKYWFIAFLLTLLALVGTNIYWITVINSYEYIYQDGEGQNNYNNNVDGDVHNVTTDQAEEER